MNLKPQIPSFLNSTISGVVAAIVFAILSALGLWFSGHFTARWIPYIALAALVALAVFLIAQGRRKDRRVAALKAGFNHFSDLLKQADQDRESLQLTINDLNSRIFQFEREKEELERKIVALSPPTDLNRSALEMLRLLANEHTPLAANFLLSGVSGTAFEKNLGVRQLEREGLIRPAGADLRHGTRYAVTDKGMQYIADNHLDRADL
jgi:chromosome segregation and condensation protein ScpB